MDIINRKVLGCLSLRGIFFVPFLLADCRALAGGNTVILKPATVKLPPCGRGCLPKLLGCRSSKRVLRRLLLDRDALKVLTSFCLSNILALIGGTDTAQTSLAVTLYPLVCRDRGKNAIILTASWRS